MCPESVFGGEWKHIILPVSRRLTHEIALFVNGVFGSNISAAKRGPKVDVRCPVNMYTGLFSCIKDVLEEDQDVLILVDRKNGNRALKSLLNTISREGYTVKVHGLYDVGSESTAGERIRSVECGTYWSAKGLECRTAIVILPGATPQNPTYVAMTRASERLIVVIDPKDPHPLVSNVVYNNRKEYIVRDKRTLTALECGSRETADPFREKRFNTSGRRNLDHLQPSQKECHLMSTSSVHVCHGMKEETAGNHVGSRIVKVVLTFFEQKFSGFVRGMEDILHPTRLDYGAVDAAILSGLMGRWAPRFVSDDNLLAHDLSEMAKDAYSTMERIDSVAIVSLAILSWDSWDFIMRSSLPVSEWSHLCLPSIEFLSSVIPFDDGTLFDIRLISGEYYVRVHATDSTRCYHIVWDATSSDISAATVRAAMHPNRECRMIDLKTRTAHDISAFKDGIHSLIL